MGRRKERRLASISAAGRRVKLDLFAEPSGDVSGSSPQEEVGGYGDSKSNAKLPSSPSSSGWLWYWGQSNGYQTTTAALPQC
ncbi:hypothetical protein CASFOL_014082 [Castilleja foliolosa]|uniref:Uncharacterized protein n=1 Tax=Castilleja foliolosa TaxID=1961234 RepID=A0ABD3DNN9_9LAMI